MAFLIICCLLGVQHLEAVVNTVKTNETETAISNNDNKTATENSTIADSAAEGTEQKAIRREVADSYGPPSLQYGAPSFDSYIPSAPSNPGLPVPIYGVPDTPPNNIIYPGPPPDIPPPLSQAYGPPKPLKPVYGPPPKLPLQRPPKPFLPFNSFKPKPVYGPPRPLKFNSGPKYPKPFFAPKPTYGPPKPFYGPPKPLYGPPPFLGPPKGNYGPPKFGPVKIIHSQHSSNYGPPEPIPHGPPHPGIPAPPTPPDIKYDGWRPIPGVVSKPPSEAYGVPNHGQQVGGDLHFNGDFVPPPLNAGGIEAVQHAPQDSYGVPVAPLDAPLAFQTDPSLSLGLAAAGIDGNVHDQQLSVIKSVGFEIFPGGQAYLPPSGGDSYIAPPANAFAVDGPYSAAHDIQLPPPPPSGVGLIPPSGLYGVPPSGQYGTPLLSHSNLHSHPLNALEINPPKRPVVFREPVPPGLIQSIGNHVAHKDAHGIIEHSSSYANRPPTYIPPPVPDHTKPRHHEQHVLPPPPPPTNLYSLPSRDPPVSFQSVAHGSATDGLVNNFGSFLNFDGAQPLTSYTAPLGIVDGSYGLPLQTAGTAVGLDHSHAASSIDLTTSLDYTQSGYPDSQHSASFPVIQAIPYDCTNHKSQPILSAPGDSLGAYSSNAEAQNDLQASHSQKSSVTASAVNNVIEGATSSKEPHPKSLVGAFGPDSELVQSQSVDFNNIPVRGALGSYTLQIQSANGGRNSIPVPHDQVLSEGLLQSIIDAIEQPQKKQLLYQQQQGYLVNEPENKTTKLVKIAPSVEASSKTVIEPVGKQGNNPEKPESLLNNDEIALYFSNDAEKHKAVTEEGDKKGSYVTHKPSTSRSLEEKH